MTTHTKILITLSVACHAMPNSTPKKQFENKRMRSSTFSENLEAFR